MCACKLVSFKTPAKCINIGYWDAPLCTNGLTTPCCPQKTRKWMAIFELFFFFLIHIFESIWVSFPDLWSTFLIVFSVSLNSFFPLLFFSKQCGHILFLPWILPKRSQPGHCKSSYYVWNLYVWSSVFDQNTCVTQTSSWDQ